METFLQLSTIFVSHGLFGVAGRHQQNVAVSLIGLKGSGPRLATELLDQSVVFFFFLFKRS